MDAATGVVHNAAVIAFDEVEAAVGDAEYGIVSAVVGVIAVVVVYSVVVKGGWCMCQRGAAVVGSVIAGSAGLCCITKDAAGADAARVIHNVVVVATAVSVVAITMR